MSVYRIRFEGPAKLAVRVATALADADGVELVSSDPPAIVDANTVALDVAAEGEHRDIAAAVAGIRQGLPDDASIDILDG